MMTSLDKINALKKINGWDIVSEFAVGGFEWLGFSKLRPELLFVISSQKNTVFNCEYGTIQNCDLIYDEDEMVAFSDVVRDEAISLVGQYGGELKKTTVQGEQIIESKDNNISSLTFISKDGKAIQIFENYSLYTFGFNDNGNYFLICNDGGITVLKRTCN